VLNKTRSNIDIFYYFLQRVTPLCVNGCNYVATGLQLCSNWYTNGAATSCPVELQLPYPTRLQLAYHTSRNWSTTRVAICVRRKLQSADGLSCNWYTNGVVTSHPGQSQLVYPTRFQSAYAGPIGTQRTKLSWYVHAW